MSPRLVQELAGFVQDLLFPLRCVGCARHGHLLCERCLLSLPRIEPPLCPLCGKSQPRDALCPGCWGWHAAIEGIRSPFHFDGAIRHAVYALKYHGLRALAEPLSRLMAQYLSATEIPADMLVAVPLHPRRLRQRGYNQSELLARGIAAVAGLRVEEGLVRTRNTPPQARTASVAERRSNVDGAFSSRRGAFKGKHILLIDDVCTTGATLDACATAARHAGAASVWALTLARESKGGHHAIGHDASDYGQEPRDYAGGAGLRREETGQDNTPSNGRSHPAERLRDD